MPGSCRRGLRPGLAGLFESLRAGLAAVLSCSVQTVQRHAGRVWPCMALLALPALPALFAGALAPEDATTPRQRQPAKSARGLAS